jgi:hypothetical protein
VARLWHDMGKRSCWRRPLAAGIPGLTWGYVCGAGDENRTRTTSLEARPDPEWPGHLGGAAVPLRLRARPSVTPPNRTLSARSACRALRSMSREFIDAGRMAIIANRHPSIRETLSSFCRGCRREGKAHSLVQPEEDRPVGDAQDRYECAEHE